MGAKTHLCDTMKKLPPIQFPRGAATNHERTMKPNLRSSECSGTGCFSASVRSLSSLLLSALLVGIASPQASAQVIADFTGGSGTATSDQYPGIAGNGWVDPWTIGYGASGGTIDAFPPTVTFLNPLNGGGNHLIFGFAG